MRRAVLGIAALLIAAPLASAEDEAPKNLQDWDPLDPIQAIKDIFRKPNATAQPPATLATYLPTNVSQSQGQNYEPFVEQAGNQANFPSPTTGPFALGGVVSRYVAIGDFGRVGAPQSVGLAQCPSKSFAGNNDVQGGLQQKETALLADQVCGLLGGCNGIVNTGDNFYQCGIYPGDTTNRFQTDYQQIYQTAQTPNLQNLKWYNTFGNHDIVIDGSVEAQIAFTNAAASGGKWQLPSNYYTATLPGPTGGPTIQATFVDANPFIIAYNATTNKYHSPYYVAHNNPTYLAQQQAFLDSTLSASTATYNLVIGHYPLFGTATQYGKDSGAYPGNYNSWANLLSSIYANKVTAYLNGHDHSMTVGNPQQANVSQEWNGYTSFLTTGAGSWGEPNDSCGKPGSYLYTNGGDGGFFIISANATVMQSDFFVLGSLFSQCTVTSFADKTKAPVLSDNCALGQPNACCAANQASCYRR